MHSPISPIWEKYLLIGKKDSFVLYTNSDEPGLCWWLQPQRHSLYKIRPNALWRKKRLKSKILPINPNYPTDVSFKIRTVFPRKNISKKYKIPPKTAKALIVYITIILTASIFQTSNCKPAVGWQCPRIGEERH